MIDKRPPSKRDRLYRIWCTMKSRCFNPNHNDYKYYGAKGVIVCEEWRDSFLKFRKWSIENGYADHLTIDRIVNGGNYNPHNCRWITMQEQNKNKSKKYIKRSSFQ